MSKQLIGWILAGIAVLWWLGYSLYQKGFLGNNWAPEIMSQVPNQFDQFVYFKIDTDLVDYLIKNGWLAMSGEDFRTISKTIDSMVMYQYMTGETAYSLLFVKDNGGFTLEKAQQLWLIPSAEGYVSVKAGKDILIYGDTGSIAYFQDYRGDTLAQNLDLKQYFKDFWSHNVGFVSKPLKAAGINPMIAQFADKLKYTQVMSKIGDQLAGTLRMQFEENTLPELQDSIRSELITTASVDSSLVIEIKNLLKLFSVEKAQFASLAGLWLWQVSPEIGTLLQTKDYETLYDVLNGQMMFEMKPSDSILWVSAKLVFQNPGFVWIVDALSPVLGGLLSNIVGSGNVSVTKGSGAVDFHIISPLVGLMGSGDTEPQKTSSLSVYSKESHDVLGIFETPSTGTLGKNIKSNHPNTLAVFYSQGPQVNSMVWLPVAQEGSGMVALEGSVYLDKRNALVVEFLQK
jgi:hypothetical protein